ncbi:twin-arginine translocase TatA/TatE family subunit [Chlorobium sp. KB01]|uniref:Sec-independent protein translocase subunit TatA/TatB n=1 Tax=Chlorobium sp. KB01 TaxID=1917528 RepID=UPI000975C454|nr:twin-arginine translocase TatA/TatE family subunit [Chlorobium sp. KB01]
MFGLGGQELMLIMFIVLLFFGPKKLPELMGGIGKGMRAFKAAQEDLENEFNKSVEASAAAHELLDPSEKKLERGSESNV